MKILRIACLIAAVIALTGCAKKQETHTPSVSVNPQPISNQTNPNPAPVYVPPSASPRPQAQPEHPAPAYQDNSAILSYLGSLKQIEAEKKLLFLRESAVSVALAQQSQQNTGIEAEIQHAEDNISRISTIIQEINTLTAKAQALQPSAACQSLHQRYVNHLAGCRVFFQQEQVTLNVLVTSLKEIQRKQEIEDNSPPRRPSDYEITHDPPQSAESVAFQNSYKQLHETAKNTLGLMQTADQSLSELCTQYRIAKDFAISQQ